MVTSAVLIALIGNLLFKSAISAAIGYEPIKITVNENFNAQPGQVSPELQALDPSFVHQGANFYFKPQLKLQPSYIPSHIEALTTLIKQHHHSCANDATKVVLNKDKLIETLKPFMYPLSDISKETDGLDEITTKPQPIPIIISEEPKPVTAELLVIPEAPELPPLSHNGFPSTVEKEVKKEKSVILGNPRSVFSTIPEIAVRPIEEPIINYVEPKPMTSELVVIPEAPVLPPLTSDDFPVVVKEEVKKVKSVILEEPTGAFSAIPEIAVRPTGEPIINYIEPKPMISELVIPKAPILSSLSLNGFPSALEEVKKEKSVILEEPTDVFPTIPEISFKTTSEPIINHVEPKPMTSEVVVIPEAPVLPALTSDDFPVVVKEEEKKDKSIILEEPTGVFPTIPEIAVRPIGEPIINYIEPKPMISEFVIPEAPVLSSLSLNSFPSAVEEVKKEKSVILKEPTNVFPTIPEISFEAISEPIINYVEPKPMTSELELIPKAPVLPRLTSDNFPAVAKEVKNEKSVILEEPTGVFPAIPEIAIRPIEEPLINYVEPKPMTSELVVIPEAPVLPPLTSDDFPAVVKEEVKKEKSIILEEPMGNFPTIPEIAVKPIGEPTINYIEPKPMTSELEVIPKAPVLPPLTSDDFPAIDKEEVKKEKSVILEEPTGVFPAIPEIAVRPNEEPLINYVEPKPMTSELVVIPEAPVLPPLTSDDFPAVVKEVKKEKSIILEEPTGNFPTIPEIAVRPIGEPTINYIEPKPMTSELEVIPKAPVLPPLTSDDFPAIDKEEVKKEKSVILEEPTGVFPAIPEIAVRPNEEPLINYVEPKPMTSELVVIPEAPVLPPLTSDDFPAVVKEEVKKEKSIILEEPTGNFPTIPEIAVRPIEEPIIKYVEPKPMTSELVVIPEAPVLPALTSDDFLVVVKEEDKKEKPIILEKPTGVFPTIPEIAVKPIGEPTINYIEPKPMTSELEVIPKVPVLPPLTSDDFPAIDKEEVKKEKPVILEEPTGVFPAIPEIPVRPNEEPLINYVEPKPTTSEFVVIPEAPVLPALTSNDFIVVVKEEMKKEKSIIFKEPTGDFPTIPEIAVRPIEEPIIKYVEPRPITSELGLIPEAPLLPPLTFKKSLKLLRKK